MSDGAHCLHPVVPGSNDSLAAGDNNMKIFLLGDFWHINVFTTVGRLRVGLCIFSLMAICRHRPSYTAELRSTVKARTNPQNPTWLQAFMGKRLSVDAVVTKFSEQLGNVTAIMNINCGPT